MVGVLVILVVVVRTNENKVNPRFCLRLLLGFDNNNKTGSGNVTLCSGSSSAYKILPFVMNLTHMAAYKDNWSFFVWETRTLWPKTKKIVRKQDWSFNCQEIRAKK